jgi:hypothetical protein
MTLSSAFRILAHVVVFFEVCPTRIFFETVFFFETIFKQ